MRFSAQTGLLPGRSLADRLAAAARFGFDAVALSGAELRRDPDASSCLS